MRYTLTFFRTSLLIVSLLYVGCAPRMALVSSSVETKTEHSDSSASAQKNITIAAREDQQIDYIEVEFFPPSGDSIYASTEPKVKKISTTRISTQKSSEEKTDTLYTQSLSTHLSGSSKLELTQTPTKSSSKWRYIFYSLVLVGCMGVVLYLRRIFKGRTL